MQTFKPRNIDLCMANLVAINKVIRSLGHEYNFYCLNPNPLVNCCISKFHAGKLFDSICLIDIQTEFKFVVYIGFSFKSFSGISVIIFLIFLRLVFYLFQLLSHLFQIYLPQRFFQLWKGWLYSTCQSYNTYYSKIMESSFTCLLY